MGPAILTPFATMYIDDCRHKFTDLAATVLPMYFGRLECSIKHPWPASIFSQQRCGVSSVAATLGLPSDFSGCYVLLDGNQPIYVGISRNVIVRLRQHLLGKDHYAASLAYAMAKKRSGATSGTRKNRMSDTDFSAAFQESQMYLRSLSVGIIEIENPLELYVFEAYTAMALGTAEWNTFRTH
jgi:hypothetical protein